MRIPLLATAALLAACQPDETLTAYVGDTSDTWQLTEFNGKPAEMKATLRFPEPGKIAGQAPCNSYSAALTVPYPWVEVGPIAQTKRACAALDKERLYFTALRAMTLAEVSGDLLLLSNDGTETLTYSRGASR